jgi:protein tyrosine phosphatase
LQKSQNADFKRKNRYNEVLPFIHSMVKLQEAKDKTDRYWYYINANYVNVSSYAV